MEAPRASGQSRWADMVDTDEDTDTAGRRQQQQAIRDATSTAARYKMYEETGDGAADQGGVAVQRTFTGEYHWTDAQGRAAGGFVSAAQLARASQEAWSWSSADASRTPASVAMTAEQRREYSRSVTWAATPGAARQQARDRAREDMEGSLYTSHRWMEAMNEHLEYGCIGCRWSRRSASRRPGKRGRGAMDRSSSGNRRSSGSDRGY